MAFKRAVMYLLASGPILLLGLIGLNSRTNQPAWQFSEYGPASSANLYAYSPFVIQTKSLITTGATDSNLLATMDIWIQGYRDKRLKDINPASAKFDGTSGAYLQILSAKHTLMSRAILLGEKMERSGEINGAALIYAKVVEIGEIGKYSEFSSYTDASSKQAQVLRRIAYLAPRLETSLKAETASTLVVLIKPRKTILDVIENIASAYRADREQVGERPIGIMLSDSPQLLASTSNSLDKRLSEWQRLSLLDPDLIPLYGKSRIANIQHKQVTEAAMVAMTALDLSFVN